MRIFGLSFAFLVLLFKIRMVIATIAATATMTPAAIPPIEPAES